MIPSCQLPEKKKRPPMQLIRLAHLKPVASGSVRHVFVHPGDTGLLIKVVRRDTVEARYGNGRPWYKKARRYRHFISYLREVREELALRAQNDTHPASLQEIVGFAETDLGFGLVVAAERDRDGRLAPTLPRLIAEGRFDAEARAALDRCFEELLDLPIVLGDLHGSNLVYAWDEEHGPHFVLIDGIGCKTLIPLGRMSQAINRYGKQRRIDRLRPRLEKSVAAAAANAASALPEAKESGQLTPGVTQGAG